MKFPDSIVFDNIDDKYLTSDLTSPIVPCKNSLELPDKPVSVVPKSKLSALAPAFRSSQNGGKYFEKYMKYKMKYLNLKNLL